MVPSISDKGSCIQSVLPAGPESTVSGHNRKSPELFPGALACVQAESGWVGPLDTQHLGTKTVTHAWIMCGWQPECQGRLQPLILWFPPQLPGLHGSPAYFPSLHTGPLLRTSSGLQAPLSVPGILSHSTSRKPPLTASLTSRLQLS